jgi:NAD(P)-dependent dehydrogenase (short-subunit alcohol dehydrogenase family)
LAKRLDKLGATVYAGCLFPEGAGAAELKSACSENLHILPLDVTQEDHIRDAVRNVRNSLGAKGEFRLRQVQTKFMFRTYVFFFIYKGK